jgi:hypothetical protein
VVVGITPGGWPVGAGADWPGGSRNGPLTPHPEIVTKAAQAIIAVMERRNIGNTVHDIFTQVRESLSRRRRYLR